MRKQTTNTFAKGMNQDRAFTRFDPEQYRKGLNVRPTTDESGDSTGSLASIRGNELNFTLPDTGNVWELVIDDSFINIHLDGTPQLLDLTIHGVNQQIPFQSTEVETFYKIISDAINSGIYGASIPVITQFKEAGVVLYTTDFSSLSSVSSSNVGVLISQVAQASPNLRVIGSIELRDSMVVFTVPEVENGTGQIWEITWDECDVATIRLVRNMGDNFSAQFPIEAVSRYEANNIRRVYWTDNENPVRSLNIDSESTYIDTINVIPSTEFDAPIPIDINQAGGALPTRHYAATYKLKSLGGSETSYSQFSPLIRITAENELTEDYQDYQGTPLNTPTTKSLTFRIDNIDTNFTNIDIVVASYGVTDVEYYLIQEDFDLTGSTSYEFTVSTLNAADQITIEEFLLQPAAFVKAKTLTIKDNRLLAGNITEADLSLEDYDSHAIRYTSGGTTDGYELTTDKRNKYNKDTTRSAVSTDQQKYQADGVTLGGTGANISFKFITEDINLDDLGGTGDIASGLNTSQRVLVTQKVSTRTLNGKTLPMGGFWNNYKNPFIEAWYKGYMRSEIYRFSIVFFDLKGRPAAAKWIADIRMPDFYDSPSFSQDSGSLKGHALGLDFDVTITDDIRSRFSGYSIVRAERTEEDKTMFGQSLIGDTEHITLFSDGSDGFQNGSNNGVIRADRLMAYGEDGISLEFKTADAPEFKFGRYKDVAGAKLRPILGAQVSHQAIMDTNDIGDPHAGNHGAYAKYYGTNPLFTYQDFTTPDSIPSLSVDIDSSFVAPFSNNPLFDPTLSSNGKEGLLNYQHRIDGSGHQTVNTAAVGNNQMKFRQKATETLFFNTSDIFTPYTLGSRIIPDNSLTTGGVWTGNGPIDRTSGRADVNLSNTPDFGRRMVANFYKELTNQYGGDTLSAINNTIYIPINHYQGFKKTDATNIFTSTIFGGDTYINIYDESHGMANHTAGAASGNPFSESGEARMSSHIIPIESPINVSLRENIHFANIGNSATGGTTSNVIEFFIPNDVFIYQGFHGQVNRLLTFGSLSAFRNNVTEFDNRVYASEAKINGEPGDSWTAFKINNFLDVDGNLGPINKLITFNDSVIYFQDSAFGLLSVNPRVAVQGSDQVQIELGAGEVLHDFNYYSTTVGSKHQWSIFQSPNAVYWFNILNKKVYRYTGQGHQELSDVKGMHSFFTNNVDQYLLDKDNPILRTGIVGAFDFVNQEALFSFLTPKKVEENPPLISPDDFTIVFSEAIQGWSSFYSFVPTHYLTNKSKILTPNSLDLNNTYLHNRGEYVQFYNVFEKIGLDIITGPEGARTKVFDAISFHTNTRNEGGFSIDQKTFENFSAYNDYQHTSPIVLIPDTNIKRKEREWKLQMPRNVMVDTGPDIDLFNPANYDLTKDFKDRIRDKYLVQQYDVLGTLNADQFIINYINTYYRVSTR